MSEPIDHHYLPRFYLSRWAGADGKLCRYSRPFGPTVRTKRVAPTGTGFEPGLYRIRGEVSDRENVMEKAFFAQIDNAAAQSLLLIEQGIVNQQWSSGPRSAWTRFLLAQLLRAPEDIAQARLSAAVIGPRDRAEFETMYQHLRRDTDPPTIDEYMAKLTPREIDEIAFQGLRGLINGESQPRDVCQAMNDMVWHGIRIPDHAPELLTSDRPVCCTFPLFGEKSFLCMPVGPRLLFMATKSAERMIPICTGDLALLAEHVNLEVAQQAVRAVYGVSSNRLSFVQEHMSKRRFLSVAERMALRQGHPLAWPQD